MKFSATDYARALAQLARQAVTETDQHAVTENFTAVLERNGDRAKTPKILNETEAILRREDGLDLYEVETARALKTPVGDVIKNIARPRDVVVERIDQSLIAGVRITRNGAEQLDATLASRLRDLFKTD
jgi:F0F1-type ATP synthase delta subunit